MLNTRKMYKPSEIAKLGLIKNGLASDNEVANYQYILNLIKGGKLKAKDYGTKSRSFWLVSGAEIKRFQHEVNN